MKKIIALLTVVIVIAFLFITASCKKGYEYDSVIIIGVDGAGSFFQNVDTPHTDKMFENAFFTYKAETVMPTISAQCWGSLLIGVLPEIHGITNENILNNIYDDPSMPSIFKLARKKYPQSNLASYCNWMEINAGLIEEDIGVDKASAADELLTSYACEYIETEIPTLMFIHLGGVDYIGHTAGFESDEFYNEIKKADSYINDIYKSIEKSKRKTMVILVSDHGGVGMSHGDDSEAEKQIMIGIRGKTVSKDSFMENMSILDLFSVITKALSL